MHFYYKSAFSQSLQNAEVYFLHHGIPIITVSFVEFHNVLGIILNILHVRGLQNDPCEVGYTVDCILKKNKLWLQEDK